MLNDLVLTQLKTILDQAHSALVILGPNPTYDQVASATAFYLALKDLKAEVSLCAPNPVEFPDLFALDEIKEKLGNKDLSISFDYSETCVDKVSYHIDEEKGKFYLVVKPQKGHRPLDPQSVSFDLTGAQADVIFLFGVHSFSMLEHLYENYADVYENATVVTAHGFEPEIGDLKLDLSGQSCWSEATLGLIEKLGLELTGESATNLLLAIDQSTEWLSSFTVDANTFESVAKLLRAGAKRLRRPQPVIESNLPSGFVPAGVVLRERTGSSSFEQALEKAREKKKLEKARLSKQVPVTMEGELEAQNELPKRKAKTSVPKIKDKMKDKNYVPDDESRRL